MLQKIKVSTMTSRSWSVTALVLTAVGGLELAHQLTPVQADVTATSAQSATTQVTASSSPSATPVTTSVAATGDSASEPTAPADSATAAQPSTITQPSDEPSVPTTGSNTSEASTNTDPTATADSQPIVNKNQYPVLTDTEVAQPAAASLNGITTTVTNVSGSQVNQGGSVLLDLDINLDSTAQIVPGMQFVVSGIDPAYFDYNKITCNNATKYGSVVLVPDQSKVIFITSKKIQGPGSIILNWILPTKKNATDDSPTVQLSAMIKTAQFDYPVSSLNDATVQLLANKDDMPIGVTEARVQANQNLDGNLAVADNGTDAKDSSGYDLFFANQKYLPVTYVADPGNRTVTQTGRTYTFTATGEGAQIDPSKVKVSMLATGDENYFTLDQAKARGWLTYTVNSDQSLSIHWTDNLSINWSRMNVPVYAPDLTGRYTLTSTYTADSYFDGAYVKDLTNKMAYAKTSEGFIPLITTQPLKQTAAITDPNSFLLSAATAMDTEDGDLSKQITLVDDGGFGQKVRDSLDTTTPNSQLNGSYQVTYTVTDSDGNTAKSTETVTVYSDIVVHYVDAQGNQLQPDTILSGNAGDQYSANTANLIAADGQPYFHDTKQALATLTGTYGASDQPTELTVKYLPSQQSLTAKKTTDTIKVGDPAPTVATYGAQATDDYGNPIPVTLRGLTSDMLQTPGTYDLYLVTDVNDGQSLLVKLIVEAPEIVPDQSAGNSTVIADPSVPLVPLQPAEQPEITTPTTTVESQRPVSVEATTPQPEVSMPEVASGDYSTTAPVQHVKTANHVSESKEDPLVTDVGAATVNSDPATTYPQTGEQTNHWNIWGWVILAVTGCLRFIGFKKKQA